MVTIIRSQLWSHHEAKKLFKNSPKTVYSQEVVMSDVPVTQINEVRA